MFDIPVKEVHEFSNWGELMDIEFEFEILEGKKFDKKVCSNPMCFDTESSNGYLWLKSGKVHQFDKFAYDKACEYRKVLKNNRLVYFHNDEEITLKQYIKGTMYKNLMDETIQVTCTYIWMLAIADKNGVKVFSGRTWQEWNDFYKQLTRVIYLRSGFTPDKFMDKIYLEEMDKKTFKVQPYVKPDIIIYVHNLGFDFQFMRNSDMQFVVKNGRKNVFARKARKPMKAKATSKFANIIFKDSYMIAQRSLENWAKDENCPIQKLVGDLDYLVLRHPGTPITYEELQYCINDVVSVVYLINDLIHKFDSLTNIPLTQTGIVRRECIAKSSPEWRAQQSDVMQDMSKDLYDKLVKIFAGGWTHANSHLANKLHRNVRCFDFASSYPWCMCAYKYPVGKFKQIDKTKWSEYENMDPTSLDISERYFIKVTVKNFEAATNNTFWSSSKTDIIEETKNDKTIKKQTIENVNLDNGKIESADSLTTYMTDLDWNIFRRAYKSKDISRETFEYEIEELYVAKADFLDKGLILTILEYYGKKTGYKKVSGKESLYNNSKTYINGIYGCSVTNFLTEGCIFTPDGWETVKMDEETFENDKKKIYTPEATFLSFQIGPFITAHARYNLWSLILKLDEHVIYGDTDSLKGIFDSKDIEIIEAYNISVRKRQEDVAKILDFDVNLYRPRMSKKVVKENGEEVYLPGEGERVCLGNFDEEHMCAEFKTLGAKRYCVKYKEKNKKTGNVEDVIECTIAGLPKKSGVKIIKDIDRDFNDFTLWNTTESDKKIAKYEDNMPNVKWVDSYRNIYESKDKFGVIITPTTFDLKLSKNYREYLDELAKKEDVEFKK